MNDYFAVMRCRGKDRFTFVCHASAKSEAEAVKIARRHGFKLPRGSYATRIGRAGYFAALSHAFKGAST